MMRKGVTCSVGGLGVLVVFLAFLAGPSHAFRYNFYWQNNQCWQTGQLGSGSESCENATAPGYLSSHMIDEPYGSGRENLGLTTNGEYCAYSGLSPLGTSDGNETFKRVPVPLSSYQEWDEKNDVCAAFAPLSEPAIWGFQLNDEHKEGLQNCTEADPEERCSMERYFSLGGQGLNDRPWETYFGTGANLFIYNPGEVWEYHQKKEGMGWGYICPVLEDRTTGNIIELCVEQWRGPGIESYEAEWLYDHVAECRNATSGFKHNADRVVVAPENVPELINIFGEPLSRGEFPVKYTTNVGISPHLMQFYIELDNKAFQTKSLPGGYLDEPELDTGCGRSSSTALPEWALIGVENGMEVWGAEGLVNEEAQPSIVGTEIVQPHPIELSAESPSEVTEHEAKIYFSVNPYGFATKYKIEYGPHSIGEYSKEGSLGYKGVSPTKIGVPLTGLAAHSPYHYRIEIFYENPEIGEAVYGEERIFSTEPTQCAGVSIAGMGSTIQGVAQDKIWNPDFNTSTNATACDGEQGAKGKPTVEYRQATEEEHGSGNCLKGFGVGSTTAQFGTYTFCGTDEPPSTSEIHEIEKFGSGAEKESVETVPVLQAPVTIIIHLPKGCTASAEYIEGESQKKLGRLVLDDRTLEKIYRGEIKTWKEVIETEAKSGEEGKRSGDKLNCIGGEAEEKKEIRRVVRKDRSGTTHIFKDFLAEVNKLNEKNEERKKAEEKWVEKTNVERTWAGVASGTENTEWPEAAKVVRPIETGGPALIAKIASEESSIGYANLADVFENGSFDKSGVGGENEDKFWVELQRVLKSPETVISYADPADKKDTETHGNANCAETHGNANCASTVYINGVEGEKLYPPISTRESWNGVVAKLNQTHYPLCGLSYDLALREYKPYLPGNIAEEEGLRRTETTENYLLFVVNPYTGGGGKLIESNNEYERIQGGLAKEIEAGIKEIGYNHH